MNFLVLVFLFLLILGFFCSCPNPTKRKTSFFVFISLAILLFLRTFVDVQSVPDLEAYSLGYNEIKEIGFFKLMSARLDYVKIDEVGFRYLMKIVGMVFSSFFYFLFGVSLLWLVGYRRVMKSYSPYIILSILLLVVGSYFQSIFVLRQHIAIIIVFLSYKYIINRKLLKYLLMISLAFLMHQTAIVALPLYFFYHVKNVKQFMLVFLLLMVYLYFNFSYLLTFAGTELLQGYTSYLDSEVKTNSTLALKVALELALFVAILKRDALREGINKLLFLSLSIGLVISICGIGFNPTNRMVMYYTSVSFLTVPIMVKYAKSSLVKNLIILLFLSLYTYMTFFGSGFVFLSDFRLDL
nr:EpsG family protein [uncultured Prevotella sp.]